MVKNNNFYMNKQNSKCLCAEVRMVIFVDYVGLKSNSLTYTRCRKEHVMKHISNIEIIEM